MIKSKTGLEAILGVDEDQAAGCDLLTISSALLGKLKASSELLTRKLDPTKAKTANLQKVGFEEKGFRFTFNEDAMATGKTAEGIRVFATDI